VLFESSLHHRHHTHQVLEGCIRGPDSEPMSPDSCGARETMLQVSQTIFKVVEQLIQHMLAVLRIHELTPQDYYAKLSDKQREERCAFVHFLVYLCLQSVTHTLVTRETMQPSPATGTLLLMAVPLNSSPNGSVPKTVYIGLHRLHNACRYRF
jgi:hypothetical protein